MNTFIPDAQKCQLQVVQTCNIGTQASFVGTVSVYEDPTAHAPQFVRSVGNSPISVNKYLISGVTISNTESTQIQ